MSADTIVVDVPVADLGAAAARAEDAGAVWAAPDTVYRQARVPNDACYVGCDIQVGGQPELATIGATDAWNVTTGSPDVVVAVLDTMPEVTHPDLAGKVRLGPELAGGDCVDPRSVSHGTGVAGIIGAATDNGVGMASLGWNTSVVSVGVLDGCGAGLASAIASGIRWAVDDGADVINLSLTGDPHPALEDAVRTAQRHGVLVVAAAGNATSSTPVYPAAYPGVLAVGATDDLGQGLASFSNRGSWVDLAAPGESILSTSTQNGGYGQFFGTSFAAPFVSAAAALIMAAHPGAPLSDVTARLRAAAAPMDGVAWGRLDAAEAVLDLPGGYWLAGADGSVYAIGDAPFRGSAAGRALAAPVVGMAAHAGGGYWLVAADGGIFSYGAPFHGSTGARRLNQPIVGMAATPTGLGYWLVAADGGIFSFGDARFFGSTGNRRLNSPVVGMAPSPTGRGYWLAAADGGVFTFGDARFQGSAGNRPLSAPVVGIAGSGTGGYWLAAADGGVFSYGVGFLGAGAGQVFDTTTAIASDGDGRGYRLVTAGGIVLAYGTAGWRGQLAAPPPRPVVAMAVPTDRPA